MTAIEEKKQGLEWANRPPNSTKFDLFAYLYPNRVLVNVSP